MSDQVKHLDKAKALLAQQKTIGLTTIHIHAKCRMTIYDKINLKTYFIHKELACSEKNNGQSAKLY